MSVHDVRFVRSKNQSDAEIPVPFHCGIQWSVAALISVASGILYALVSLLSRSFAAFAPAEQRPIIAVLLIIAALFACYFAAILVVTKLRDSWPLLSGLLITSAAFRLILLPSWPILEIDFYRYIWDGAAVVAGVSPYAYPPQHVVDAAALPETDHDSLPLSMQRLVEVQEADPALATILRRIHFAHLSTPYPPVSQAVFAAAVWTVPPIDIDGVSNLDENLERRVYRFVVHMKSAVVAFDLATLVVVCWLLKMVNCHVGWSVAYGWCPLVLKEFANTGHLDSIAIFFTTLSIALALWTLRQYGFTQGNIDGSIAKVSPDNTCERGRRAGKALIGMLAAGVCLSIGIGSKLYPVVLLPLLMITAFRRFGWKLALIITMVTLGAAALVVSPMNNTSKPASSLPAIDAIRSGDTIELPPPPERLDEPELDVANADHAVANDADAPPPPRPENVEITDGLFTFLRRWEMNDLIFSVLVENLRSQQNVEDGKRPWFAIFAEPLSEHVMQPLTRHLFRPLARRTGLAVDLTHRDAAFLFARGLTALVWLVIACISAWRASSPGGFDGQNWLRAAFFAIAWFWLLSPTQNPWYWCWALPLVCFARQRAWLGLGAFTLLYYTRFYFAYHTADVHVLGTRYHGEYFFHFVIVWIEFGAWLLWLFVEWWLQRYHGSARNASGRPHHG